MTPTRPGDVGSKRGLVQRIGELIAGVILTLAILISGLSFTYSAFRSPAKLRSYRGVVEQTKLVGKGRKWFVFTLRGLPFALAVFHADQDYNKLLRNLASGDTVVAYYAGPYPAQGAATADIATTAKDAWQLTKGNQELISLADKQGKEGILGIFLLVLGLGMMWTLPRAFRQV